MKFRCMSLCGLFAGKRGFWSTSIIKKKARRGGGARSSPNGRRAACAAPSFVFSGSAPGGRILCSPAGRSSLREPSARCRGSADERGLPHGGAAAFSGHRWASLYGRRSYIHNASRGRAGQKAPNLHLGNRSLAQTAALGFIVWRTVAESGRLTT